MDTTIDTCKENHFTTIHGFRGLNDYKNIFGNLRNLVEKGLLKEVPMEKHFTLGNFEEHWFQCPCGKVWRIVEPDFPFKGTFRPVES